MIDLNFQEYEVKDRENNIYKHLQFRDVYDNKMNFMVLRDYEDDGLSYYRTETIYIYDLNNNTVQTVLDDLDKFYHIWSFIYLDENEYLYCVVDLTEFKNDMFTYYVIYEKDDCQKILNSGMHHDMYAAPILTVQGDKIYYFCESYIDDLYRIQLYEFDNGNSKLLIERSGNVLEDYKLSSDTERIIDFTPQVTDTSISFCTKNDAERYVHYYENDKEYSYNIGISGNCFVFDDFILCIEPIEFDKYGDVKEVEAFAIDKKTNKRSKVENLDILFGNIMMLSENSALGVSEHKLYYLSVEDNHKIKISEIELNHEAIYCRKIDNTNVLVFDLSHITKLSIEN